MTSIGIVTVGRSDYGIYRSLLRQLAADARFELRLYVTGMHLSPEFGETVKEIERDGFPIFEKVDMLVPGDTPQAIAESMGRGVMGFSKAFAQSQPDLLIVLGDRFEMFAATTAAVPFAIPIAHLHGGEITSGAIDEAFRHSMTKMSHLHFVSTEEYARRVTQLGEDPSHVTVCGAPALDEVEKFVPQSAGELELQFGLSLDQPPLLVTFHPATIEHGEAAHQIETLLAALDECGLPAVFTAPNADTASRAVRDAIVAYVGGHDRAWLVESFGQRGYFSMMCHSAAMVGNSSSGIIEAASFHLPVVNIGNRQAGRVRGANVLDVSCTQGEIATAIRQATSPEFRKNLATLRNPYHPEIRTAAAMIIERIAALQNPRDLLMKHFRDLPSHD